jgi:adenylate cyclase class 2
MEIEAKVVVDDLASVAESLQHIGAEVRGSISQRDIYFTDENGRLLMLGCGLRIRQQSGDVNQTVITFKGPMVKGPFKIRPEIEVEIGEADAMQKLLEGLGYRTMIEIRKHRQSWHLGNCEICLDEVEGLGKFVEVEGPSNEAVSQAMQTIGLDVQHHINRGYASMMMEKMGLKKSSFAKTPEPSKPKQQFSPKYKKHKGHDHQFHREHSRENRNPRDNRHHH